MLPDVVAVADQARQVAYLCKHLHPSHFKSGTTVLSEDKMHVSVDGVLRTLAAPDWQNNLAQHSGSEHAYIARRDQNYVAIAGQFDDKPFFEVLGNLEPIGRQAVLRYDGQLDI